MAYFSNGTEGEVLDEQCSDCRINMDAACPILWVQMTYNYEQVRNEKMKEIINCLVDKDGICQMKPIIDNEIDGDTNE